MFFFGGGGGETRQSNVLCFVPFSLSSSPFCCFPPLCTFSFTKCCVMYNCLYFSCFPLSLGSYFLLPPSPPPLNFPSPFSRFLPPVSSHSCGIIHQEATYLHELSVYPVLCQQGFSFLLTLPLSQSDQRCL